MLDKTTFDYLKPSEQQIADMTECREAAAAYARVLDKVLPGGPDKTHIMRKHREVAMWANVTITRQADGSPRVEGTPG